MKRQLSLRYPIFAMLFVVSFATPSESLELCPATPTNLAVTTLSPSQIHLTWTDLSTDETGFTIESKVADDCRWLEAASVGQNVTNYLDEGLRSATWYTYRVSSYNDSGNSVPSQAQSARMVGNGLYLRSSWPGYPRAFANGVHVSGNYAYVANWDAGLFVIDISNPANPTFAGQVGTACRALDVYVSGNYAYVVNDYNGFDVIDVSDPTRPTRIVTMASVGGAGSVYVSGNYAYVGSGTGLKVVDISDPAHPTLTGSFGNGGVAGVYVSGNYAYVADGANGFKVIDISDPAHPTLTGSLNGFACAVTVDVSGHYAYVGDWYTGLKVVDISDPAHPTLTSSLPVGNIEDLHVSGNYAYVAAYYGGLKVVNISNPAHPTLAGTMELGIGGWASGIFVSENRAYLADFWHGLRVVDISNPANPTLTGSMLTSGGAGGLHLDGNYAYLADGTGLKVVDISDPVNPTLTGSLDLPGYNINGYTLDVHVSGKYAYIARWYAGLGIIDISDPAHPTLIGSLNTDGLAYSVYVSGNYAYVADGGAGLKVINISDLAHPTLVSSLATGGSAGDVYVRGNYAYVMTGVGGLKIVDISDPVHPVLTASVGNSGGSVCVNGNYAYVADGYLGRMNVIDISDPAHPSVIASVAVGGYPVHVSGTYLYSGGLNVTDISDPAHPRFIRSLDIGRWTGGVAVRDNYAYLADNMLKVVEIRLPPHVQNAAPANIAALSATLCGNLTATGGLPTTVRMYWGAADGAINPAAWENSIECGVLSGGGFSSNITGLRPDTLYYYRCWASNEAGAAWAPETTNFRTRILNPPSVVLNADPDMGERPLTVTFTAVAADDGVIANYLWDLDGDGLDDLATTTNVVTYRYDSVGTFVARVTVVDNDGLPAQAIRQIVVQEPAISHKIWISKPPKENKIEHIWGDAVKVIGHVAPGNDTEWFQFEYKLEGEISWLPLGGLLRPEPRAYKLTASNTWNVTSLLDGSNYNLRAVAQIAGGLQITSVVYTVMIDSAAEGAEWANDGKHKRDLVVSSISFVPEVPARGGVFTAVVTVKNRGTTTVGGSRVSLWANKAAVASNSAKESAGGPVGVLGPGQSRTMIFRDLPAGIGTVGRIVRVFVDSKNVLNEANENNNQMTKRYTPKSCPDFVITGITLSTNAPKPNSTFSAYVTVKNQGYVSGDGGYLAVWAERTDEALANSTNKGYTQAYIGTVSTSKVVRVRVTGLKAGTEAAQNTLKAMVDSRGTAQEVSETNNQFSLKYTPVP